MILKVRKQKQVDEGNQGHTELITEYYQSESFVEQDGFMTTKEGKTIFVVDYSGLDEISGNGIRYVILDAFLMNDEGKTIERIR